MSSVHPHPRPAVYRRTRWLSRALLAVMLLAVPLQIVLALLIPGAPLFYLTALITLGLTLPVIMGLYATPPVTVTETGLTLQPGPGGERHVTWDQVQAVKPYPLLPPADSETMRRALVGRKQYQAARGIMLVIPALPLYYRVTGFFAGEGWTPVIALTNRTHVDYESLEKQVTSHCRMAP